MSDVSRLIEIMARLRDPDGGCPWDLEQDFASIAPYTIEEAYEVDDAIRRGDLPALRDELGDLLLQVVYHARMAEEAGHFAFGDVVQAVCDKLVRRHPHVFGDARVTDATAQSRLWEDQKAAERAAANGGPSAALAGVPLGLPALERARKLQGRAARVGFTWERADQALAKLGEELGELAREVQRGDDPAGFQHEVGDLLFAATSLARAYDVSAETALRDANARFERRFHAMEAALGASGRAPEDLGSADWLALWEQTRSERRDSDPGEG